MPRSIALRLIPLVLAGLMACEGDEGTPDPGDSDHRLEINLQVTGARNLSAMMRELDRRGVLATVWLEPAELEQQCATVQDLAAAGHEIAGKFPGSISDQTTREEQRQQVVALLDAAEACGAPLEGFRATRFTANADTPQLLDELGLRYLERSAREEFLSVYTFEPYPQPGHDHAVLPMPIIVSEGEVGSMSDSSACNRMSAEELLAYVQAASDFHLLHGKPLILEWHPSLTHPDDPDGWWDAFLGVLDHLQAKGDRIRFVTARELVDRYAPEAKPS